MVSRRFCSSPSLFWITNKQTRLQYPHKGEHHQTSAKILSGTAKLALFDCYFVPCVCPLMTCGQDSKSRPYGSTTPNMGLASPPKARQCGKTPESFFFELPLVTLNVHPEWQLYIINSMEDVLGNTPSCYDALGRIGREGSWLFTTCLMLLIW